MEKDIINPLMIGKDFIKSLKMATSSIERIRPPAKEWVIRPGCLYQATMPQ
jgi:hypothetical protein